MKSKLQGRLVPINSASRLADQGGGRAGGAKAGQSPGWRCFSGRPGGFPVSVIVLDEKQNYVLVVPVHPFLRYALPESLLVSPERTSLNAPMVVACPLRSYLPRSSLEGAGIPVKGRIIDQINSVFDDTSVGKVFENLLPRGIFAAPGSAAQIWNRRFGEFWYELRLYSWEKEARKLIPKLPEALSGRIFPILERIAPQIKSGEKEKKNSAEIGLYPIGLPDNETLKIAASPENEYLAQKPGKQKKPAKPSLKCPRVVDKFRTTEVSDDQDALLLKECILDLFQEREISREEKIFLEGDLTDLLMLLCRF